MLKNKTYLKIFVLIFILNFTVKEVFSTTTTLKELLSKFQLTQRKIDLEIVNKNLSLQQKIRLSQESKQEYLEIKTTFYVPELMQKVLTESTANLPPKEKKEKILQTINNCDVNKYFCFFLEFTNNSKTFSFIFLDPIKNKIRLNIDNNIYEPAGVSESLKNPISNNGNGWIYFAKLNNRKNKIVNAKTKDIRLEFYDLLNQSINILNFQEPDFIFVFSLKNYDYNLLYKRINLIKQAEDIATSQQSNSQQVINLFKENKIDKAISLAEKLLAEGSEEEIILYNLLGAMYLRKELYDVAISYLQKAIEINPFSALTYYELGLAYQKKEDWERAEISFKQAINIYKNYVAAHFELANTLVKLGKKNQAKKEYQKTLKLNPYNQEAKEKLEKLKP